MRVVTEEVAELKKASTGKQKYGQKGGAARQQAGRELQQVQAKMQQYRDRGEVQRLELAKCTEQLKRESTRAASAEKALAKAIQEESKMREAATGGVQQNSKAQMERRNAEIKAEKARAEVQRLHEKNKALNVRVAEMEKELGIKAGAEMKQRRVRFCSLLAHCWLTVGSFFAHRMRAVSSVCWREESCWIRP